MDDKLKEYIEKQESPKRKIIQTIREIFHKTLPDCNEKIAWGVIAYAGGKFYIAAMKNRVHIGFAITGLSKDEINLFEGTGKTMRHIKIHSLEDINEENLVKIIHMVNKKASCPPDFKG